VKKRNIILIIFIFLIVCIGITFGIFKLFDAMKSENEKVKKDMEEIHLLYDELNENASSFNKKKEEYDSIMSTLYYTNVQEKNKAIVNILNEYDLIIGRIIETGNHLKEKCAFTYTDNEVIQKCNSYQISYESAVQVFQKDIKRFNTLVENYNAWTKENSKYKTIEKFTSKYVE
jgi:hypothetical protein